MIAANTMPWLAYALLKGITRFKKTVRRTMLLRLFFGGRYTKKTIGNNRWKLSYLSLLHLAVFLCLGSVRSHAQSINLVFNPDFEEFSNCPMYSDEVTRANFWTSLDSAWRAPDWLNDKSGVPDYENACSSSLQVSVPVSYFYNHLPHSGDGMMGLIMFYDLNDTNRQSRDYLQGRLKQNLMPGRTYQVQFYTTMMQTSGYAIDHIGAYLDNGAIDTTSRPGKTQSQYSPQAYSNSIINDTLNWRKVSGTFTAIGNETHVTIGNFFDLAHTHTIPAIPASSPGSWAAYLVDDVSLIDCSNVLRPVRDTAIAPGDSVAFGPRNERALPYNWYIQGSSTPFDSGRTIVVRPTVQTTYILEQDLCGIKYHDTMTVRMKIPGTEGIGGLQAGHGGYEIFPNPNKGAFTIIQSIADAAPVAIEVQDALGRRIYTAQQCFTNGRLQLDLGYLPSGVYMLRLIEGSAGNITHNFKFTAQ